MTRYDGRAFAPVDGGAARGHYRQVGDVVWATFSGGPVTAGRLVGRADSDGVIAAAYCQLLETGEAVAGRCMSTPTLLPDGRIRLTEQWERIDGTTGVSVIEEIA